VLAIPVRLGAATLLALAGLLLAPATAHACSCVAAGPAQHARWADVVLDGVVVGQDVSHPSWPTMSSGDPVTYRVEVRRVFKGRVGPVTPVRSAVSGVSCGVDLAVGRRYVVFAYTSAGGELRADQCGGTRPANRAAVAAARRLGSPYPPDAAIRLPERHLATTAWGVGGAALALVAMVASGLAVRSRPRP
jgi:Tissue inhibitor of metalloproteinase